MFIITFVLLFLLCLFLYRIKTRDEANGNILDYQTSEHTKALLMLLVIVHHLSGSIQTDFGFSDQLFKHISMHSGTFLCSLFFFFSGYGLMYSLIQKPNYLSGFAKRILKIGLPYIIANIVFITYYTIIQFIGHNDVAASHNIAALFNQIVVYELRGYTLVEYAWFIDELILFYIIFYVCNRFFSIRQAMGLQCAALMVLDAILFHLGWGHWRYSSNFGFLIGQLFCWAALQYKSGKPWLTCAASGGVGIVAIIAVAIAVFGLRPTLAAPLCVLPVIIILTRLKTRQACLLNHFSSVYFEAYMYQGLAFIISQYTCHFLVEKFRLSTPWNGTVYLIISIMLAIILGSVFHYLDARLFEYIGLKGAQKEKRGQ